MVQADGQTRHNNNNTRRARLVVGLLASGNVRLPMNKTILRGILELVQYSVQDYDLVDGVILRVVSRGPGK